MAAKAEEIMKEEKAILREARKEAELEVNNKKYKDNAEFLTKANKKLAAALEQAQAGPNTVQILAGTTMAAAGGAGGFILNRKIRKKLREKAWVNEKGERSMANIAVADGVPIVVGLGMFIGGCYIDNGVASAAVCGAGAGLVGGVITSAATADAMTP